MRKKITAFLVILLIAFQAAIFFASEMSTSARIITLVLVSIAAAATIFGNLYKQALVRSLGEAMAQEDSGEDFDVDAAFERAMRRRGKLPQEHDAPLD
ncbi:hypothetical protein K3152_03505 [Qipengyuania sp. 1NDH17]|uniref:Uncharacterized protein n=1 Tax=Qipengyuania polymorpha TaxID=2867234 RepID=A0ABS7IVM9_9SPHN|nr:hypothetical protein [Qipengyuania polymorpha]MBX7457303.1 hypothetical protein [Qipengyuania polymorpha]